MDPKLLDYYNKELLFMRELGSEFAALHPKIARRLGMNGTEVADPYVERLIESFSFLSARTQIKLDAEFPRFMQRLLEVLQPNYLSPTPAMSVAQIFPGVSKGDSRGGFTVPRGTAFHSNATAGENTACEFRSGQDVTVWPIELVSARLTGTPADVERLDRFESAQGPVRGALRLRLRTNGERPFGALGRIDRIPIYVKSNEPTASQLLELLHSASVASLVHAPTSGAIDSHVVTANPVIHEGLGPAEGLLPLDWNMFHGHNLLREFFVFPERFNFFTLAGLAPGLARIPGHDVEIVVLLTRAPGALERTLEVDQLALFCTPIVNLFNRRIDRAEEVLDPSEIHVVPDRTRPLDFEVHSISRVSTHGSVDDDPNAFRPLYESIGDDRGNHRRYFSVRREPRLPSETILRYGHRSSYIGNEIFISLVDQREAPHAGKMPQLSVASRLTNRDLPTMLPRNGTADLTVSDSYPITSVGMIKAPSSPRPSFEQGELAWRLVRQLAFNHLPLVDLSDREGGQALRDMLKLFVGSTEDTQLRQIDALVGSRLESATRRLPGTGPLVYGRGVVCTLSVDESRLSGGSPYLFGLVLEQYLARHVSVNAFSQTVLESRQRGLLKCWPIRAGNRGIA